MIDPQSLDLSALPCDEVASMSSAIAEAEAKSGVKTPNYDLERVA